MSFPASNILLSNAMPQEHQGVSPFSIQNLPKGLGAKSLDAVWWFSFEREKTPNIVIAGLSQLGCNHYELCDLFGSRIRCNSRNWSQQERNRSLEGLSGSLVLRRRTCCIWHHPHDFLCSSWAQIFYSNEEKSWFGGGVVWTDVLVERSGVFPPASRTLRRDISMENR